MSLVIRQQILAFWINSCNLKTEFVYWWFSLRALYFISVKRSTAWSLTDVCPKDEVLAAPGLEGHLVFHDYTGTRRVDGRVLLTDDGRYLAVAGDVAHSRARRLHPTPSARQIRRVGLAPLVDAYRTPAVPVAARESAMLEYKGRLCISSISDCKEVWLHKLLVITFH